MEKTSPTRNHKREEAETSNRRINKIITGSRSDYRICSSYPPRRDNCVYRQCIGVFVSKLHKSTRMYHIERHDVYAVSGLLVKCNPLSTKVDTHSSYCTRTSEHDAKLLLISDMWPNNVIVKPYFKIV